MEEKDTTNSKTQDETAAAKPQEKQPHHPPTVTNFGTLGQLVQGTPGSGPDASPFPDCRRSR